MKAVTQYLKNRGFSCVRDDYYSKIDTWGAWYKGKVSSVHNYTQYNGKRKLRRTRKTLRMAKTVSEDWANLLLNEKLQLTVENKDAQDALDAVLSNNNFRVRANQMVELSFALGTGAFVEYLDGEQVKIDYIRAGMIYPLSWDNGHITECAFASEKITAEEHHVYLNIHRLENEQYVIENHMFRRNGSYLTEITLPDGVQQEVFTNSSVPHFQIIKPNLVNCYDPDSPFGISVYDTATDSLEHADVVFDSYSNEFRLGKKRITVPMSMLQMQMEEDGTATPVFDDNDTEFYAVPIGEGSPEKITEHNMELRADAHERGIQTALNLISWKCGFGMKRYSFQSGQVRTATEVVSDRSDLVQNLRKHEILLKKALTLLVESVGDLLGKPMVNISVDFDDSVIEDTAQEKQTFMQEIRDSIRQPWEYRVRFFGETEEAAKQNVAAESLPLF